jgi:predicted aldo/keto reductase-like oxidoreductase
LTYCARWFDDNLPRAGSDYAELGMLAMVDTGQKWDARAQEALEHLQRYKEHGRIACIDMSSHHDVGIYAITHRCRDRFGASESF